MRPEIIAIVAAALSGVLTLTGVWLAAITTHRRETGAFRRDFLRNQLEATRALFEDTLVVLDRVARTGGRLPAGEHTGPDLLQVRARLMLRASKDVRQQFEKTAEALDEWAEQWRAGEPEPLAGGVVMIKSGQGKYREAAEKLYPIFDEAREKLIEMMRQQLAAGETRLL